MKKLKTYQSFLEKKGPYDEDLEFEFLANVGKMKETVIKVVEMHEKHYYNDTKMSSNSDFKQSINDLIDSSMTKKDIFTEDYLSVIKMFEDRIYGKNLFHLNDENWDESMFGILDDLVGPFSDLASNKNRDNDDIRRFGEDVEHISKMKDDWIYQKPMDESREEFSKSLDELGEIGANIEKDEEGIWQSEEEFDKDMSDYIGKPMDDFDYTDRLQAYKYIENKPWVKSALEGSNKNDREYIKDFLKQIKDNFGI